MALDANTEITMMTDNQNTAAGLYMTHPEIVGALVWSSGSKPRVDPQLLKDTLIGLNAAHVADLLPAPTSVGTAITRAISRVSRSLRSGEMEWVDTGLDKEGHRVILLCSVTTDADQRDITTRAREHVLVDERTGAFVAIVDNPMLQGSVDEFRAAYERERGVLGAPELWNTIKRIARRTATSFSTCSGQMFVSDASQADLEVFDKALVQIEAGYRLRMMPFYPETQGPAIKDDAVAAMMEEVNTLRALWDKRKEKAQESGKRMRIDGVKNTIAELTEMASRYGLMSKLLKAEALDFEAALNELNDEITETLEASFMDPEAPVEE